MAETPPPTKEQLNGRGRRVEDAVVVVAVVVVVVLEGAAVWLVGEDEDTADKEKFVATSDC